MAGNNPRISMKKIITVLLIAVATLTGCDTLQTPDARVTLASPHVATPQGLVLQSEMEPGTYAVNQVLEPGTYERAEIEAFAPGPLPRSVQIEPGQTPSQLENTLSALGGVANTIPGGQPIGLLFLGAASLAKIWRDSRTIKDTRRVAQTLAQARDSSLDVIATLPDREQAERLEQQIEAHTNHFAANLGKARDLLDTILAETATPTKKPLNNA